MLSKRNPSKKCICEVSTDWAGAYSLGGLVGVLCPGFGDGSKYSISKAVTDHDK